MDATDIKDTDQEFLLTETLRRETDIAEYQPASRYDAWAHSQSTKNGPAFSISGWCGNISPADRKRVERALRTLEQRGYVTVTRTTHGRVATLKLTATGRPVAERISNHAAVPISAAEFQI